MTLPDIAISMGDPAGIGPEVTLRAIPEVLAICRPQVIGNRQVLHTVAERLGLPLPSVPIVDPGGLSQPVVPGRIDVDCGRASYGYVIEAIDRALAGDVAGIVTGPIQKEAWHAAGVPFPGHTELLQQRTGAADVRMMLTAATISCVLVTVHVGYAQVPELLSIESVLDSIRKAHQTMQRIRGGETRVTVCGLNPHAGENGLFGDGEEQRIILPAIEQAGREGISVVGPLPPDTAFTAARRAETDVYVCMYHDQGLIPLKTLAFDDAVNVTLGLPIVRTSVDHGTAMDIAWTGQASHHSMVEAIRLAVQLGTNP
ncbi:4-hydroxythreonine-4-phosphate dehydrogenase PdxA [Roseimaritima ulvae]|uniref:4-hydroxythreonine-4-phosphate dehydrogenase n=1 Tax=Roseimaritima ulvae TaxID=980254 RepID=A0A5B9QK57_9BACT|nr:4-hydroxythreonine-4-phosphate dehydrogenase PdxA [Roseimaritima ulvae]QEG39497.1 4-hydroxythreonine-4-phosphate dehydrogenase [Roseimaritima ulvae]